MKNNLGCGKEFKMNTSNGFICGVPNGWGKETLCLECDKKLRKEWEEDDLKKLKGGLN